MEIEVIKGDITEVNCESIVNPANSFGIMGGGVAYAIKKKGGKEIEEEARKKAPIEIGKAIATKAGNLKAKYVIHSPTMKFPASRSSYENVRKAVKAAMELALKLKVNCIAFPGMGTGVGGLNRKKVAKIMVEEILKFKDEKIKVMLVGYEEEMYEAFKEALRE